MQLVPCWTKQWRQARAPREPELERRDHSASADLVKRLPPLHTSRSPPPEADATEPLVPEQEDLPSHSEPELDLQFAGLYAQWRSSVRRWVSALGAPPGDVDDVTQEVFIIVRRKLSGFDSRNVAGWLFRIAERTVRDFRQKAWFRRATPYHRAEQAPSGPANRDQAALYEAREALRRVERALARMSEKRREAFVRFAFHGYSGEEIAALDGVPIATVWSRIHQARRELSRATGDGKWPGRIGK